MSRDDWPEESRERLQEICTRPYADSFGTVRCPQCGGVVEIPKGPNRRFARGLTCHCPRDAA